MKIIWQGLIGWFHLKNLDLRFSKLDGNTHQSPDYDSAADKVEITVKSGASNVSVNTK